MKRIAALAPAIVFLALVGMAYLLLSNSVLSTSLGQDTPPGPDLPSTAPDLSQYLQILSANDARVANLLVFFGIVIATVPFFMAYLESKRMEEVEKLRAFVDARTAGVLKDATELRAAAISEVKSHARVVAIEMLDDEFAKAVTKQSRKLTASYVESQTGIGPVLKAFALNDFGRTDYITSDGFAKYIRFELFVLDLAGGSRENKLSALDQLAREFADLVSISTASQLAAFLRQLLSVRAFNDHQVREKSEELIDRLESRAKMALAP